MGSLKDLPPRVRIKLKLNPMIQEKLITKDDFNFFVPLLSIEKGKDKSGNEVMIVEGIASTDDQDEDEEILVPEGYILDRFKSMGFINWNHMSKSDPSKIIGEPIDCYVKNNKFYIKGMLYPDQKQAKDTYALIQTLKKAGSTRKLGWSIEGKALQRDPNNPKRIIRALITGVAITPTPVNGNTFVDLVKGSQKDDFVDYEFDESANGGQTYILDVITTDNVRVRVDKNFNIIIGKAMSTVTGRPLIKESLDKRLIKLKEATTNLRKAYDGGLIEKSVLEMAKEKIIKNF